MKKCVSMLLLLVIMCGLFTGCKLDEEDPFDYIEPGVPYDTIPPDHPRNNVAYC